MGHMDKDDDYDEALELDDDPGTAIESEVFMVPVEELGSGVFNALGQMVGGIVSFGAATSVTLQQGVQNFKERISSAGNRDGGKEDAIEAEIMAGESAPIILGDATAQNAANVEPDMEK